MAQRAWVAPTVVHAGSYAGIDRAYRAPVVYVAQQAVVVGGTIREHHSVGPADTHEESKWRTEVRRPIFQIRPID